METSKHSRDGKKCTRVNTEAMLYLTAATTHQHHPTGHQRANIDNLLSSGDHEIDFFFSKKGMKLNIFFQFSKNYKNAL